MGNNILNLYLTIEIRIVKENDKSEPVSNKDKVRICTVCERTIKKIFSPF